MILIVALNLSQNNFEITRRPLFLLGNKYLEEIQLIVIFTEAANLAQRVIDITKNLAIMTKKKVL